MATITHNIIEVNADNFANLENITREDANLLTPIEVANTFAANDNFIELTYYSPTGEKISTIENYTNFSVLTGDTINGRDGTKEVSINVLADYKQYNSETSEVVALYNFLDYSYSNTNTPESFYIESISPDRTEVRLVSVELQATQVLEYTNTLITKKDSSPYAQELFLYEGSNTFYSVINIDIEPFRNTYGVLIKLLEPLPQDIALKSRLNVVEKISESTAYRVLTQITQEEEKVPFLRGANFSVEIDNQSTEPSQYFNYDELFSFPTNNSNRELNTLFNKKGAELSIDYSDYQNFINFSSAEERILNFKYKLDLIESYQTNLDLINTSSGTGVTGSATYYRDLLNGVVDNLDHYESHLYYESGSTSWPKSNNTIPYINELSNTPAAETWFTTQKTAAIQYDSTNPDILTNSIPAYLKEDQANDPYNLFIDLIGQHFDNIWVYTDAVSKKYNADNRLNEGVSKDLVEDLLKNFGVKLYTSNRSASDLYRYFTLNSYDQGDEILPQGIISGSDSTPVSEQNYQREVYKRIYHNLPLLMKSKGTERGVRALITCFGIPSDILKVKLYGGQSSTNLPFYGGEEAFTGSLDKIRIDNNNVIVEGDTLSNYTSIYKSNNDVTQDLHRIEIGFSPADNINNYIASQSAVLFPTDNFNIDNYIGDPRSIETNNYQNLNSYRDVVLENLDRYEVEDFIRLIKFFDNNIFRMVRDFIPARTVADTGVIIKSHLLERNKMNSPVLSWTQPEHTGSLKTGFISGSNAKSFDSTGPNLTKNQSKTSYTNRTQTPEGIRIIDTKLNEQVKFDGEFSGSVVTVTDGELNKDNPFKILTYNTVLYNGSFYEVLPASACSLTVPGPLSEVLFNAADYVGVAIGTVQSQITNYPLVAIYDNPISGVYSYSVDSSQLDGNFPTYNFRGTAPYTQYKTYSTTAENISEYGAFCTTSRDVKVIYCNVNQSTTAATPSQVTPLNTDVNIGNWWSNTGLNNFPPHDTGEMRYKITNGSQEVTLQHAQVTNFDFSSNLDTGPFVDGQVYFKIYDNTLENGTHCSIEFQIPFLNCILQHTGTTLGITATNTDASATYPDAISYKAPFKFTGYSPNAVYYARLTADSTNTGQLGDDADTRSDWCEITNTTAVAGVLSLPTGPLGALTESNEGGIDALNNIVEPNNGTYTYPTFRENVAYNGQFSENNISIQIKVIDGTCIATSTFSPVAEYVAPPEANEIEMYYNSNPVNGVGACCPEQGNEETVYSEGIPEDFNDFSSAPDSIFTDDSLETLAPQGYYKHKNVGQPYNQGTAGYWSHDNGGTWITADYEDCTNATDTTCN